MKKRLNIALVPDLNTQNKIINLSKELSLEHETLFTLDGKNYYPHLTLYSPAFPNRNSRKIESRVKSIAENISKIEVEDITISQDEGYLVYEFLNAEKIKQLHAKVINEVNVLREEVLRDKYMREEYLNGLIQQEKENIKNYGYPRVLDLYTPHLTITRFVDSSEENVLDEIEEDYFDQFVFDKIGVFEMGSNGTCVSKLYSENL